MVNRRGRRVTMRYGHMGYGDGWGMSPGGWVLMI